MTISRRGFTLIETIIASMMIAGLIGAIILIFQFVSTAWSSHYSRTGTGTVISRAVEDVARTIRGAKEISGTYSNEIRFTVSENGVDVSSVYYLYSQGDGTYQLRKAALSGGIEGTFQAGSGDIIARNLRPPPDTTVSCFGRTATIDLSVKRADSVIRYATKVTARNI